MIKGYERTINDIYKAVNQHVIPGVSFAFVQGNTVNAQYYGQQQLVPKHVPLAANRYYDLASLTKVIGTTMVILHLIEEHQLTLETPIVTYLPQLKDVRITIRHLLTHTSGVTGFIPNRNQLNAHDLRVALMGLSFGENFNQKVIYSDIGMLYLGFIIEVICQRPVQTVISDTILHPLDLACTFSPRVDLCVPTTVTYEQGTTLVRQGVVHDPKSATLGRYSGAAGLFGTLGQLISFVQFMCGLSPVKNPPVHQSTLKTLSQDYTNFGGNRSLGWDLRQDQQGDIWLYHTGYTGTFILQNINKQQGFIFLSNRVHPVEDNKIYLDMRDQLVQLYLSESLNETD